MTLRLMTLRCDHCRGQLAAGVHRYWHMRFCSPACVAAYQERLAEHTKTKIRRLDRAANDNLQGFGSRRLWPDCPATHPVISLSGRFTVAPNRWDRFDPLGVG